MDKHRTIEDLEASVRQGLIYMADGLSASCRQHMHEELVPVLSAVLDDLCSAIEQFHILSDTGAPDSNPAYVIHYTSVAAVVSMLQAQAGLASGNTLRLYDSAHFNDPDDGNRLVRHLIQSRRFDWLRPGTKTPAYVASFMIPDYDPDLASDNLVFWRTYGREGEGCSLKLRTPSEHVRRVLYTREELERTSNLLCPVLDILDAFMNAAETSITQMVREVIWGSLGRIWYLYKSPAYQYERECRFVIPRTEIADDRILFDYRHEGPSSGRLRHYCEDAALSLPAILGSGSSITIGPAVADRDDLKQSLELLKKRAGIGAEVRCSEISYRRA